MKAKVQIPALLITMSILLANCGKKADDQCILSDLKVSIDVSTDKSRLTAVPTGGQSPYHYKWSNSNVDADIYDGVNLVGVFKVTVTDFIKCTAEASVNITSNSTGCAGVAYVYDDAHKNFYDVIEIGSQCWFREDVADEISFPKVEDAASWKNLSTPAFCYSRSSKNEIMNVLYNGYAMASGKLCPKGWHIPTKLDWQILIDYLGGESLAGLKLKTFDAFWVAPFDLDPNPTTFFNALPGGRRQVDGSYIYAGTIAHYWGSTSVRDLDHYYSLLIPGPGTNVISTIDFDVHYGMSCRCVKD